MNKVHSLRSYRGLSGSRDRPEYGRCWIRIPPTAKIFIFSAINSEHNEPKTFLNDKVINDWNYKSFSVRLCPHHTAATHSNRPELEQVVHTHRICAEPVGREGLVSYPSQWIPVLADTESFRPCPSTFSHSTKVWHTTYPICDAPLLRSTGRGAASLRYRNRAEITALLCEQKHYPIWFSCWRKSIDYSVNIALECSCHDLRVVATVFVLYLFTLA